MRTVVLLPLASFLALILFGWVADVASAAGAGPERPAGDHLLLKFKPGFASRLSGWAQPSLEEAAAALGLPAGARLEEPAINGLLRDHNGPPGQPDFDRFLYLRLPPGPDLGQVLESVQNHPWVEYAETDGVGTGGLVPNDPNFGSQWHHQSSGGATLGTPSVWDTVQGNSGIIVAVLDTGLDATLAEFAGRVVPGYNFASNSVNTADDHGHGTAVAGTLAATGNNGMLVAGVDWRCRILPIKILGYDNTGQYSWWAQGIDFAVQNGAKVINLSAGGFGTSVTLTRAITNAIAQGVIVVTITHNDGQGTIRYPGNLLDCITVGATDSQDRRCGFSNYGPEIDLVAPGTNIITVGRQGVLQSWWGTSLAAPLAAGVCSLLASVRPDLTQAQARALLVAGADDGVGDANDVPGFDVQYGWGRLNAYNSLILAQTRLGQPVLTNQTDLHLSWPCPPNAANKQPYVVERASSLAGPWTAVKDPSAFRYASNQCALTDIGGATNQVQTFYRVRLRAF